MRTKDEVIKMFRKQEDKSAEQIINWYKAELKEDVNARLNGGASPHLITLKS